MKITMYERTEDTLMIQGVGKGGNLTHNYLDTNKMRDTGQITLEEPKETSEKGAKATIIARKLRKGLRR